MRVGDLEFVGKYLGMITPSLRDEIITNEYKKGNTEFIYKNFERIDNAGFKESVIEKEFEAGNFEFLYKNYDFITNAKIKEKVIERAFKDENVNFLNNHSEDMPKSMKLEAAVKFSNFRLSPNEINELFKK